MTPTLSQRAPVPPLTAGPSSLQPAPMTRLWTQVEAAEFLGMSPRWLRDSNAPKILLPGNGPRGRPTVRYDAYSLMEWAQAHSTTRRYR
jgi:hypothetical protein